MANKNTNRIIAGAAIVLCIVLACTPHLNAAQYKARLLTYTIKGSVGLSGVTISGFPDKPVVTDSDGNYTATVTYGWSGTVTPTKEGYTFEPATRKYTKVTADQANQSYSPTLITFTFTGSLGMEGITMNGLPGNPVTDARGVYTATVDYGFSGTVTPTKQGYIFEPANRIYTKAVANQPRQDYTPTLITFTISGSAGMEAVTMNGLPGNPVTDARGAYTATVNYGFRGTVTPTKEGYTFDPATRKYTDLTGAQPNHNYIARILTYTISGSVGLEGVIMNGLPGNPATNTDGTYTATVEYGFNGTITPTREGYTLAPATRSYTNVTSDQLDHSYTPTIITYTVSGSVGMPGIVIKGLPGDPVTDAKGSYTTTVNYGWSGTVTPTKEGYTFTPANRIYGNVSTDRVNQSFTPALITFTISGTVGMEGVVMNGLPGNPITGKGGLYSATVDYGWSGIVTPTKEGYTLEPAERPYKQVAAGQANQSYTATLQTRTIAGTATAKGIPLEGVKVSADRGAGSAVTNANGTYTLQVDYGWNGTVTPAKEGYTFEPTNKAYSRLTLNQSNQAYSGTLMTFVIAGSIVIDNTPIEGVLITASNAGGSTVTNAKGRYSLTVPYAWTGTVTPTKEGHIFDPPSTTYTNVTSDQPSIDELLRNSTTPNQRKTIQPIAPKPIDVPQVPKPVEQPILTQVPVDPILPIPLETPTVPDRSKQEPVVSEYRPPEAPTVQNSQTIATPNRSQTPTVNRVQGPAIGPQPLVQSVVPDSAQEPLITNVFVDTELRQALQDIASQAGVIIIPDETVVGMVTCEITDAPLSKALEIVLAGTGYIVTVTPDYYLIHSADPKSAAFPAISITRVMKLNYAKSDTAVKLLSTSLRNYVQADPDIGTVCITAPPVLMTRIVADLKLIDRLPRHVMLDARIVVMERSDLLNVGVEWGWPKIKIGTFSDSYHHGVEGAGLASWPWGIQIGYTTDKLFTDSLMLTLNLLAENGELNIIASPQVIAQDGKEAEIKITTEEYYMLTAPESAWYTRAELEKIESGTVLNITPHIGENDHITLDLAIEVSDVVERTADNFPVITRRTTKNTVRIKDGGTVAVAGLTENRKRLTNKKVPGLSNLPLLGPLFRNEYGKETSHEVAIFITARLVTEAPSSMPLVEPQIQEPLTVPCAPPKDCSELLQQEQFRKSLQQKLSTSGR